MEPNILEIELVQGNTWVLKSWALIPFYKLDDHRCILLDTGLVEEQAELDATLRANELVPVGILCSHAHIDHMGNNAFLKEKYGAQVAMSLGEAGHQFSYLAMNVSNYLYSPEDMEASPAHQGTPVLADRIILPGETRIDFCGATFEILSTPGHTCDHICVKTPDDVLYLGDAMMTGRTLHRSKFPYAFCMRDYLDSMRKLRTVPAARYVAAHYGVYEEILPLVDMEVRFLTQRMLELVELVEDYTTPKLLAAAICRAYRIKPSHFRDLAYFEAASLAYINYLRGLGHLEAYLEDDQIRYRRTADSARRLREKKEAVLPKTGQFR